MAGAADSSTVISGLTEGATYSISMVANSSTIPSDVTTGPDVTIERANITLASSPSSPILAGGSVTITCSISLPSGVTGTPVLRWEGPGATESTRNDGSLSSNLTLSSISTSQAGVYMCTATLDGSVSADTNITVQVPTPTPFITNSTIIAGSGGNLTCSYAPGPYIFCRSKRTWTVGGEEVTASEDDRISTEGTSLVFSPFHTSDTGNYTCSLSLMSMEPYIEVVQGPQMSQVSEIIVQIPPPGVAVSLNRSGLCMLELVSVSRVLPLWTPVSTMMRSTTNHPSGRYSSVLTISPLAVQDNGPFTCTGTVTGLDQSQSATNTSSTNVSNSCSIQPPSVDTSTTVLSNWSTPGGRNNRVNDENETSPQLVISRVETADSGDYTCSVRVTDSTNSPYILDSPLAYNTTTITVKLNVTVSALYEPAPGEVPGELGPNEFTAGSNLTLNCSVEGHSGALSYMWSLTGNPSTPSGCGSSCNIDISSTTSTLVVGDQNYTPTMLVTTHVLPLPASAQGVYTCTIPDSNGNDISLNVGLYPPGFNVTPTITNLTYHEGNDSHTLTCVSTGSPATNVSWTKDGAPLTSDYTISQTVIDRSASTYSNVLTVSPEGAAGTYNCTVSNDLGSNSSVVVALGITVSGEDSLTVGQSGTISCRTNVRVSSIEWRNQSTVLASSSSDNLTLLEYTFPLVTDDLHGQQYTCTAVAGDDTYRETVSLVVKLPENPITVTASVTDVGSPLAGEPGPTLTSPSGSPKIEVVPGEREVVFSWSPPPVTQRNGVITSYTLSCSPSPSSLPHSPTSQSGPHTVAGFSPNTHYSCSLVASNIRALDLLPTPHSPLNKTFGGLQIITMRLLLLVLCVLYWSLVDSQTIVIRRSHNDTVYIGTQLTLTAHISLSDVNSVDVTWTRGNDVIANDSHTSVVSASGSTSYMSSLSFSPVTSYDGGPITATVTATATATSPVVTASDTHILMVTVPRPVVIVSVPGEEQELVSGSSLSLSCFIQPLSVDTYTTVLSNWSTPGGRNNRVNAENETSPQLDLSSVETADSGDYNCSVRVTDSTNSLYILDSPLAYNTTTITVKLNVTVSALYEPAPGEVPGELGPNQFTAGSNLTLNCSVEGHSGALIYMWSLTGNPTTPSGCGSCNINTSSTTSTLVVGGPELYSYYAGDYTCTVDEIGRSNSGNSHTFPVNVVGAGIYALRSGSSESSGPIANNGLIVSENHTLILECVSNSNMAGVGSITTPDGTILTPDSTTSTLSLTNPF
ncbi:Hemicentin-2, partial [Geodia barretti]